MDINEDLSGAFAPPPQKKPTATKPRAKAPTAPASPDLKTAPTWASIEAKPEFQQLSDADKLAAKSRYFDYWIAPNAGAEAESIRQQFLNPPAPAPEPVAAAAPGQAAGSPIGAKAKGVADRMLDAVADPIRNAIFPKAAPLVTPEEQAAYDAKYPNRASTPAVPGVQQSLMPVSPALRRVLEAQYNAATKEERLTMAAAPGGDADFNQRALASVARELNDRYGLRDKAAESPLANPGLTAARQQLDPRGRPIDLGSNEPWAKGEDPGAVAGTARNLGAGLAKIPQTFVKGAADIGQMLTGGAVGGDLSAAMQRGMDATDALIGTNEFNRQKRGFAQIMSDDTKGVGDMFAYLLDNPAVLVDESITTIGSMFLPVGAAAGAAKLSKLANLSKSATAKAATATTLGTIAAQNAADTFSSTADLPLDQRYQGAAVSFGVSLLAGIATKGGAEGAIARRMIGDLQAGKIGLNRVKDFLKAVGKEAFQEAGEEAGNVAGEATARRELPSGTAAAKRTAYAGALGGVMGGGVNLITGGEGAGFPGQPAPGSPQRPVTPPQGPQAPPAAPGATATPPAAPTAPAAPEAAASGLTASDQELLDYAEARLEELLSKVEGGYRTVDTPDGPIEEEIPPQELTDRERQEFDALRMADGDAAKLRQFFGDTPPVSPATQESVDGTQAPEAQQAAPEGQEPGASAAEVGAPTGKDPITALGEIFNPFKEEADRIEAEQQQQPKSEDELGQMFDELVNEETGQTGQQQEPPKNEREALERRRKTTIIAGSEKLEGEWAVVEADDVKASMKEGVNQPRDRTRAASNVQISEIARNPDFERLSDTSKTMDYGAPTLTSDDVIVGGNGRFEGISLAYDNNTSAEYRKQLEESAAQFGLDAASVRGMKKPILVRRITQDADTRALAIQSNQAAGLQLSDMEQAALDAERMTGLDMIQVSETGDIPLNANNIQAINNALRGYGTNEQSGLIAADGTIAQSGLRRIRNAIMYKAYGKSETLARLIESPSPDLKNVGTALVRAAAELAKTRTVEGYDISQDITEAVETLSQLRAQGRSIEDFLAQIGMFGDSISPEAREILQFMNSNIRSARAITEFLQEYAAAVKSFDESKSSMSMFGDADVPTKLQTLSRMRGESDAARNQGGSQTDIFAPGNQQQDQPDGTGETGAPSGEQSPGESGDAGGGQADEGQEQVSDEGQQQDSPTTGEGAADQPADTTAEGDGQTGGESATGDGTTGGATATGKKKRGKKGSGTGTGAGGSGTGGGKTKADDQPDKLENTGEKLWGSRKDLAKKRLSDAKTGNLQKDIQKVLDTASRSRVWNIVQPEGATTGTTKFLTEYRNSFESLLENLGKDHGGGRGRYEDSYSTAVERWVESVGIDALIEEASGYIELMEQMREATRNAMTIAEAKQALLDLFGVTFDSDKYWSARAKVDSSSYAVELAQKYGPSRPFNKILELVDGTKEDSKVLQGVDRRPPLEHIVREELPDRRNGKDVNGEDFMRTFGFRGVEFGEWLNAADRQANINHAYDALFDLADALGAPPKAISLGGTLGLAFGSRGRGGRAAAHYEPDTKVINLTKTKGDGTLAHEWGHALDYALSAAGGEKQVASLKKILSEYYDAAYAVSSLERLMNGSSWIGGNKRLGAIESGQSYVKYAYWKNANWGTLKQTKFQNEGDNLGKDYWGTPVEMWARAFEAFVFDELGKSKSPYLVSWWVGDGAVTKETGYKGKPYASGTERERFNDALRNLVRNIDWTENGPAIKSDYQSPRAKQVEDAKKAVEDRLEAIINGEQKNDGLYWYITKRIDKVPPNPAAVSADGRTVGYRSPLNEEVIKDFGLYFTLSGWQPSESAIYSRPPPVAPDKQEVKSEPEIDLEALFDEVVKEETSKGAGTKPSTETEKNARDEREEKEQKQEEKSPIESIKSAGQNTAEGLGNAIDGLGALFGGNGKLNSGFTFDEETYAKAKPYFIAAAKNIIQAGKDIKEAMRAIVKMVLEKFGQAAVANMKPYVVRFLKDYQEGKIKFDAEPTENAPSLTTAAGRVEAATQFANLLSEGQSFPTIGEARRKLSEITGQRIDPGTESAKLADEVVEAAVVIAGRRLVEAGRRLKMPPADIYDRLVSLYNRQPNLAVRSSTSVREQAYSTPVPLAYLASELAGITQNSKVLEPTAGNGMLLIGADKASSMANELNANRAAMLRGLGFANVTTDNAATASLAAPATVDAVIANPPFGAVKDDAGNTITFSVRPSAKSESRYDTKEVDHAIAFNALKAMRDDGTAVLIVGGSLATDPEARKEDYRGAAKRGFYFNLYGAYNVVDHFTVAGSLYSKQGASYPVDVIVIKGRGGQSTRQLPAAQLPEIFTSFEQLKEKFNADTVESPGDKRPDRTGSGQGATGQGDGTGVGGKTGRPGDGTGGTGGAGGNAGSLSDSGSSGDGRSGGSGTVLGDGQSQSENAPDAGDGQQSVPGDGDGEQGSGDGDLGDGLGDVGRSGGLDGQRLESGLSDRRGQEQETATQVAYTPKSNLASVGTLVPTAMRDAIQESLQLLEDRVGNLDEYVAKALEMDLEDLRTSFSAEQVDALAMAINNAEQGNGFIIGDQTGIGKGRVVAGMIRYALRKGRVPIFVTEKPNLYADMIRDLDDIGMNEELGLDGKKPRIFITNKSQSVPYSIIRDNDGEITETMLTLKPPAGGDRLDRMMQDMVTANSLGEYRVIFTTYNQLQNVDKKQTKRQAFIQHFGKSNFIIFDESHNAGGSGEKTRSKKKKGDDEEGDSPAVAGRAGFARALVANAYGTFFSSATYAKRPDVMDLYSSTNMKLAVEKITQLADAIKRGGVPMQQIVATMLTKDGQYIRRERTFAGVSYDTQETVVDKETAENMASSMRSILRFSRAKEAAVEALQERLDAEGAIASVEGESSQVQSANFGSIMHNLIDQMLLALKVQSSVKHAIDRLKAGEKVVMTVSNTMGSFLKDYADEMEINVGDPITLSFADLYLRYLEKQRIVTIKKPNGEKEKKRLTDAELGERLTAAFNDIESQIKRSAFGSAPISPIDFMHAELRKAGYKTDEITGRTVALNYSSGTPILTSRSSDIKQRVNAVRGFNNGSVDVIILNQAGSTGLSLHASAKFSDQRKRHMIVVQPEKNIDTHMQMLGRVHRTGQVVAPAYSQMMADIPAEQRPAAVLLKKMASLNANTTASRKSAVTAEGVVDFMNDYGGQVVQEYLRDNPEVHSGIGGNKVVTLVEDPAEDGEEEHIRKFTGYIPIFPVAQQRAIYDELIARYNDLIERENSLGSNKLEAKALDLDADTISIEPITDAKSSDSIFAREASMERVDVKRAVKPYTSAEVRRIIEERLVESGKDGNNVPGQISNGLRKTLRAEGTDFIDQNDKRLEEDGADPVRRQDEKSKLEAILNHAAAILDNFQIGNSVQLKNKDGLLLYGFITDISSTNRTKNPASGSNWKMQVVLANGDAKSLTLSFSQIGSAYELQNVRNVNFLNSETGKSEWGTVYDMLDKSSKLLREKRWIVTGNILAGYTNYPGQIITYTKKDGTIGQGVLMGRQYDFEKDQAESPVRITSVENAMKFMLAFKDGVISSTDGNFRIENKSKSYRTLFKILTPAAKRTGGQFYLNKDITKITGDFYKSGSKMYANVDGEDNLRSVFETVLGMDEVTLTAVNYIIPARKLLAPKGAAASSTQSLDNIRRSPLGLYSALERFVALGKVEKAPAAQWIATLQNAPGVKADELFWSGLSDWLKMQEGQVTKQAVLDYLSANGVKVSETVLGGGNLEEFKQLRDEQVSILEDRLGYTIRWQEGREGEAIDGVTKSDGREFNVGDLWGDDEAEEAMDRLDEILSAWDDRLWIPNDDRDLAKYRQYQIPGGDNYREVLLKLPAKQRGNKLIVRPVGDSEKYWEVFNETTQENEGTYESKQEAEADAEKSNKALVNEIVGYRSAHWDQPNVLAHIRVDDRVDADGKRVLFVQEIQSDWGQQGKKKGFANGRTAAVISGERNVLNSKRDNLLRDAANLPDTRMGEFKIKMAEVDALSQQIWALNAELQEVNKSPNKPSPAPFVTKTDSWVSLALKRIMVMAAEGGYDRVAFITGQQAVDLYDLSKQVDELRYGEGMLVAIKNGTIISSREVSKEELPDNVGKEAADRLLNNPTETTPNGYAVLSGVDLKVGGEGMRAFYDQIVPAAVKKLLPKAGGGRMASVLIGKPAYDFTIRQDGANEFSVLGPDYNVVSTYSTWGAAEADAERRNEASDGKITRQPGFDVTDAMRQAVGVGLPLFNISQSPAPAFAQVDPKRRENFRGRIDGLQKRLDAGKMTDAEFQLAVKEAVSSMRAERDARRATTTGKDRRRGADWVKSRLRKAASNNEIPAVEAAFAEWLIDQNPAIAEDLAISIRRAPEGSSAAANYSPAARLVSIFKGASDGDSTNHEILHHTERMMPEEVQAGIFAEWQKAFMAALRGADKETRKLLLDMLAASYGSQSAKERVTSAFNNGLLTYNPHYQLYSPSEFWAVNGSRILADRFMAQKSWVKRAKQWLKEMIEHVKGLLGLPSDAPVLRALKAVLEGDGEFQPGAGMLTDRDRSSLVNEIANDAEVSEAAASAAETQSFDNIQRRVRNNVIQFWGNRKGSIKNFSGYDRTIATQYHKALKDPDFGKVFALVNATLNAVSTTSIRPAELAPGILPKVEDVRSAVRAAFGRGLARRDLEVAANAVFAGTLVGKSAMDGRVWSEAEFMSKFDGANAASWALYKQSRAAIDASLDELAAAEAYSIVQDMVPRSARSRILDDVNTARPTIFGAIDLRIRMMKRNLEQAVASKNDQAVAEIQAEIDAMQVTRDKVLKIFGIAKQLKEGGYAPLMRFGRFGVTVTKIDPLTGQPDSADGDATLFFARYESESEAKAALRELKAQYGDDKTIKITAAPVSEKSHELYSGISPETIAIFAETIGAESAMKKYIENVASERSALKRRLDRKGTAGFNREMPRVLSNFITSNARYSAQRYFMKEIDRSISRIPKQTKGDVRDEAIDLKNFVMSPSDSGAAASSAMFVWFLTGSVAAAAVNLTQTVTMTMPYLSQFGGPGALPKAMAKAMPVAMGKREADPELRAALKRANQEGIVDAQEIFHLYSVGAQSVAKGVGKLVGAGDSARARLNATLTLLGSMFSLAEKFNRKLAFTTAYELAREIGAADPYAFAVRTVNTTQGVFSKAGRPNWARSIPGRLIFTFKQFSIMYVEMFVRMWKHGGPEGKRACLIMLGVLMLLAGEEGLPFMQDLNDLIDTLGQIAGYDTNVARSKRRLAHELLGKELGDFFLYGMSSALPLDWHGRLGVGNLIPGTGLLKPSNEGRRTREIAEIIGPSAGAATQMSDAVDAAFEGKPLKALQNASPKFIKDAMQAAEWGSKGYATDSRGRMLTEVDGLDVALKGIGFQPTAVAERQRAAGPLYQDIALQKRVESSIIDAWASGIVAGDDKAIDKAAKKLDDWNRKNPDTPVVITQQQLMDRVKTMSLGRDQALLKTAPRELRGRVAEGLDSVE
jgi:hypothetical protein